MLLNVLPYALVDAISVGTLAIPVWFLLAPHQIRTHYLFLYLSLVAAGYGLIGLLIINGPSGMQSGFQGFFASTPGMTVRAVVGVTLLAIAAWYGLVYKPKPTEPGHGRLFQWRESVVGDSARVPAVVGVAAAAVALEIPTAVPYAVALSTIADASLPIGHEIAMVAVYVMVMVLPATCLTVLSIVARRQLTRALTGIDEWLRANAQENTAWLLALVGVALIYDTPAYHGWLDWIRSW